MIDLHTHSTASDGALEPAELVQQAAEAGLQAIALTDHDTVDGWPAFSAAAVANGIEPVPGIEISCSWYAGTLHMLGYFIDTENAALLDLCRRQAESRERRLDRIAANLAEVGVELDVASVRQRAAGSPVGRPHIADELIATGVCRDQDDVYRRFLGDGSATFTKAWHPLPEEAIAVIHGAGGLAIHAHPTGFGSRGLSRLKQRTHALKSKGLDGLEAWYGPYEPSQRERIAQVAASLDLAVSGGSDFHGPNRSGARLATPKIDYQVLQTLKDRNNARKTHFAAGL